jgi:hypothetical protein
MAAVGQPDVPGFNVTKYADVPAPDSMAFSPDGALYILHPFKLSQGYIA